MGLILERAAFSGDKATFDRALSNFEAFNYLRGRSRTDVLARAGQRLEEPKFLMPAHYEAAILGDTKLISSQLAALSKSPAISIAAPRLVEVSISGRADKSPDLINRML